MALAYLVVEGESNEEILAHWRENRAALADNAPALVEIADLVAKALIGQVPDAASPPVIYALSATAARLNALVAEEVPAGAIVIVLGLAAAALEEKMHGG